MRNAVDEISVALMSPELQIFHLAQNGATSVLWVCVNLIHSLYGTFRFITFIYKKRIKCAEFTSYKQNN